MEARVGIEPTDGAFAELCLTTWLPRLAVGPFRTPKGQQLQWIRSLGQVRRGRHGHLRGVRWPLPSQCAAMNTR